MPEVSRVTLRRDMAELAEAGALKRTHGGAILPDAQTAMDAMADDDVINDSVLDNMDLVIFDAEIIEVLDDFDELEKEILDELESENQDEEGEKR